MLKYLASIVLSMGISGHVLAGAKPWPGVEYKSVKVYLYNLDDRLFGQHQPVKENKLDTTIIQPGATLTPEQVNQVLKVSNENTNLLELGLSSCFLPHHAIVFFDANEKPVAYISICFMCDAARFYPYKKLNEKEVSNPKKEKVVLDQLDRLKKLVLEAGLPVYKDSPGYNAYGRMVKLPATDSIEVEFDGFTKTYAKPYPWAGLGFADFKSCSYQDTIEQINAGLTVSYKVHAEMATMDSTVKIAGNKHYYFFGITSPFSEVRYSKGNGMFLPDYARIHEPCFGAVLSATRIGDDRLKLWELLN
ncbi:MAG: hypothetical protein ACHQF2_11705, partial [Flavobacteriales bacterium]